MLAPAPAPASAEELADTLAAVASEGKTISVAGNNSKRLMAGPALPASVSLSTSRLRRVLQYERNDLTISVEAGLPFAGLQQLLARNGQMIALDPPFASAATVGGVVASNTSGPMRRAFGTARDQIIGMTFATLAGKLIKTGGMVVKNVAGLDMGKLMIGSFGTLAVMTSVNFRVHPLPPATETFLFTFPDLEAAIAQRDRILKSVLQPLALDLVSPPAAARLGRRGFLLALRAGGSTRVLDRYARELPAAERLASQADSALWQQIQEFTPDFLRRQPQGVVLRFSTTLSNIAPLLKNISGACVCRAASGIVYVYLSTWQSVAPLFECAAALDAGAVVEFAPDDIRSNKELWRMPPSIEKTNAFAIMKKVKYMLDPGNLLNRGRLYARI